MKLKQNENIHTTRWRVGVVSPVATYYRYVQCTYYRLVEAWKERVRDNRAITALSHGERDRVFKCLEIFTIHKRKKIT